MANSQPGIFAFERDLSDHQAFMADYAERSWSGVWLRWLPWLGPIVLLLIALESFMTGNILEAALWAVMSALFSNFPISLVPRIHARQLRKTGFFDRYEISMNEAGFTVAGASSKTTFDWSGIDRVTRDKERIFIWYNSRCAIVVPFREPGRRPSIDEAFSYCASRVSKQ